MCTSAEICCLLLCSSSTDLVLYCEAFLTTYRTFITPEDLIKKLHYRYPFQITQHVTLSLIAFCVCVLAEGCSSHFNPYLPRNGLFILALFRVFSLKAFVDGELVFSRESADGCRHLNYRWVHMRAFCDVRRSQACVISFDLEDFSSYDLNDRISEFI